VFTLRLQIFDGCQIQMRNANFTQTSSGQQSDITEEKRSPFVRCKYIYHLYI
jgi:hypothetical protein